MTPREDLEQIIIILEQKLVKENDNQLRNGLIDEIDKYKDMLDSLPSSLDIGGIDG